MSSDTPVRRSIDDWSGVRIAPGESQDISLAISESYSGMTIHIPIHVRRAVDPGPVVFVTAALHGDEINGTGAVRHLVQDDDLLLTRGAMIFVPVLNLPGFDRHSRYLPDRRDLNRSFPGSDTGTLAGRMARRIFDEIVARSDYGIDIHTAAVRRTNYPTVRGDLSSPEVFSIAEAFGAEILIDGKGPQGAFRREASRSGCHTIVFEGGEVWKVEPAIVETTVRGVKNVLRSLDMLAGKPDRPSYQVSARKSQWIRAERGGFLDFHVGPGDVVEKGQALATNTNLLGQEQNMLYSPFDGVVIGMTTLPAISPGEPVCHIAKLPKGTNPETLRRLRMKGAGLEERTVGDLASNVMVVEPPGE
ncbi:MAG: succinylglutamate desuccinylase/aspartoacylase family protein [Rhodopirellula sp.]|nr:succinylglutamate desuccinylase/aspartoacylase family protein [Rhodopirellula sp.]